MASFIYSPDYRAEIGQHVFPMEKFRLVHDRLIESGDVREEDFIAPEPASLEDLLLVHTKEYVDDLLSYEHSARTMASELPISKQIIDAYLLGAGGTILACEKAMEDGRAMNLTGGFHHCFADKAEGFCYVNDVAVGIRRMQTDGRIEKALVVDCDLHQGNGTAHIFRNDASVFTFSIHQENNYPVKQKSDLDIGLRDFAGDEEYLSHMERRVPRIIAELKPDLIVYLAGADPYQRDQLGGLRLTMEGLQERDRIVVKESHRNSIPIVTVLAGGYAFDTSDTVQIHYNTCRVLLYET